MEFTDLGRFDTDAYAIREDGSRVGEGRAEGLHLGEIIGEMRREAGLAAGVPEGEPTWLRAQTGFLFEWALELIAGGMPVREAMDTAFKRYMLEARAGVVKQITTVRDDIHMTPDGIDARTLESYKFTWKSMRKAADGEAFSEHFWPWLIQEGAYLASLRLAGYDLDAVKWYVFWANGDYSRKPGNGPQVRVYQARFTQQELDDIWARVLRQAMKMRNKETVKPVV